MTAVISASSGRLSYSDVLRSEHVLERGAAVGKEKPVLVRKSNQFITAKYKASLLANKIMAISLTRIEKEPGSSQVKSTLTSPELQDILGMKEDANVYRKLKTVSKNLAGNIITIEDGGGNFKTFALVTNVEFVNGKLTIYYNKDMTPYIVDLRRNYTSLELGVLTAFQRGPSFRLYELLKKECYRIGSTGYTTVRYGVNELRAELGLINTDAPYIARYLRSHGTDWDFIVENVCKKEDVQCYRFTDLKNRVLEPAREEIREISDLRMEYEEEKAGHGKVISILFIISYNNPDEAAKRKIQQQAEVIRSKKEDQGQDDIVVLDQEVSQEIRTESTARSQLYADMRKYLSASGVKKLGSFTQNYFEELMTLAGQDPDVVKRAIDLGANTPYIHNYYGWLRRAVQNRYAETETVETSDGQTDTPQPIQLDTEAKQRLWERCRLTEDFQNMLKRYDLSEAEFELIYTLDERIKRFYDFKARRFGD